MSGPNLCQICSTSTPAPSLPDRDMASTFYRRPSTVDFEVYGDVSGVAARDRLGTRRGAGNDHREVLRRWLVAAGDVGAASAGGCATSHVKLPASSGAYCVRGGTYALATTARPWWPRPKPTDPFAWLSKASSVGNLRSMSYWSTKPLPPSVSRATLAAARLASDARCWPHWLRLRTACLLRRAGPLRSAS